jgi:hypothetical protein
MDRNGVHLPAKPIRISKAEIRAGGAITARNNDIFL